MDKKIADTKKVIDKKMTSLAKEDKKLDKKRETAEHKVRAMKKKGC